MNLQAKVFQRFVGLGVPVLEYYMKCPKESNNNLQAPALQIKPILKMFRIHLSKITGHLYAHRCDCGHVHTQDTEQPSGKPPHISLRTKVTRQDKKRKPTWRKLTTKNLHSPDTRPAAPLEYAVGWAIREADCLGHNWCLIRQQHTTATAFHGCSSLPSFILKTMERIEPWPQLCISHPSWCKPNHGYDIWLWWSPTSSFVCTQYLYSDLYCLKHQLCWEDRTAWQRCCSLSGARSVYVEDQSRTSVL